MPTAFGSLGSLAALVYGPSQIFDLPPGSMLTSGTILPENLTECQRHVDISPTAACDSET